MVNHKKLTEFIDEDFGSNNFLIAGSRGNLEKYMNRENTISVDISSKSLKKINNKKVQGNILNLPFKENSFDVVIFSETIEHLPSERVQEALKELKRVTRNFLYLTTPNNSLLRKIRFRLTSWKWNEENIDLIAPDHKKEYSLFEIKRLCESVDYKVTKVGGQGSFLGEYFHKFFSSPITFGKIYMKLSPRKI